ncbi:MAG: hypothetical protein II691_02705 [Muribaculaceae bacterium]|nr:hypothetical protein [Muribaculaceae bacterium]
MVQAEASGKTCFDIGEAQPIDAERAGWGEYDSLKNRKKGTDFANYILLIFNSF